VRAVVPDEGGRLWLATNNGVAVLEPGESGEITKDRPPRVFGVRDGLPGAMALAVVPDANGAWVAVRDGGLARIGAVGVETTLRSGVELPAASPWCAARDGKGRLIVGTRGGGVLRVEGSRVTRFGLEEGLPDLGVFDVKVSPSGVLFAATSGGVARLDEASGRFSLLEHGPDSRFSSSSLAFEGDTLWIGLYGRGVVKVRLTGPDTAVRRYGEESGLPNGLVTGLFVDREGSLWIATHGGGVVQLAGERFASYPKGTGWPGGVPSSFAEEDGALWIGSFGKGLVRLERDGVMRAFGVADGLGDERVRTLLVDRQGTLLAGTSTLAARPRGAARFTTLLGRDELAGAFVTALAETDDGTLYVGTSSGLLRRRPDGSFGKVEGLPPEVVESLGVTPDGRLWAGVGRGVSLIANGRVLPLAPSPFGIPEGRIFKVAADNQGRLWFAGDGGLALLKPGRDIEAALTERAAWRRFGAGDGLSTTSLTALAIAADGAVWVGSGRGLSRFDGERFRVAGRDELPSSEILNRTGFRDGQGRLWWGTPAGPVVYHPDADRVNSTPPAVFVTEVEADGHRFHGLPHLDLAQGTASVTFRYAALTYREPGQVLFRTRLDGFDADWSPVTNQREVRYTNLPAGRFTFQVLAANSDGVWARTPATLEVSVPTPWWLRPWLLAALAVLVTGLVAAGHELRLARVRRRTVTLERLVDERTEEIRALDARKSEFVSMVSHELRAPLTAIRGTLEVISGETLGTLPPKAKELVAMAHRSSERLGRLIDDLLDVERIESGKLAFDLRPQELLPLLTSAVEVNRAYASQHGVSLELAQPVPQAQVTVDADRLVQVATNLLSNAVKFSPKGGAVTVTATLLDRRVRIAVADQGPGIPEDFRHRIFERFSQAQAGPKKGGSGLGLSIAKGLVEGMGGTIGFTTETGGGTTFFFEIPVDPAGR